MCGLNRVTRTSIKTLPPSADSVYHDTQPGVTQAHPTGAVRSVKTFCGVTLRCVIVSSRYAEKGIIYTVRPHGHAAAAEFARAGVPTTDENAWDTFVAFDWQVAQ